MLQVIACAVVFSLIVVALLSRFRALWSRWDRLVASVLIALAAGLSFIYVASKQLEPPSADDLVAVSVNPSNDMIIVRPRPSKTVYNPSGGCIGFFDRHDPDGKITPSNIKTQTFAEQFNDTLIGQDMIPDRLTAPGGLVLGLFNCGVLDPKSRQVVDITKLAGKGYDHENYDRFIFVFAYSLTPKGPEQFASYGITYLGKPQGFRDFDVEFQPESIYMECCEAALQANVASHVAFYRGR
jgi:hypothetical protein